MERREFLYALALVSSINGGCSGLGSGKSGTTASSTNSTTPAESATVVETKGQQTPQLTKTGTEEARRSATQSHASYDLGETYENEQWLLRVEEISVKGSFTIEDTAEDYAFSNGKRLVISEVTLENKTDRLRSWFARGFSIIADGETFDPQMNIYHPELENKVYVGKLPDVDHGLQFMAEGYPVEGGDTGEIWLVAVVPSAVTKDEVSIEYGPPANSESDTNIRWKSSEST